MSEYGCRYDECTDVFETKGGRGAHEANSHGKCLSKHNDEKWLRQKYHGERKSLPELAKASGVTKEAIRRKMVEFDIERRSQGQQSILYAPLEVSHHGYEVWRNVDTSLSSNRFPVHRLLAVSKYGFDKVAGSVVHHKNGVPWDNRLGNIEVMSQSDHAELHFSGTGSYSEFDKRLIAALHDGTKHQMSQLASAVDANVSHLYEITAPYR